MAKKTYGMNPSVKRPSAYPYAPRFRVIEGNKGKRRHRRSEYAPLPRYVIPLCVLALLAAALVVAAAYIATHYQIEEIYVEGNVHYTEDEIAEIVTSGRFGGNSLYLSCKYRDTGIEGVPFVEKMTVEVLSPTQIRVIVYEKSIAGYVEYLGRYMYFDKDGIIVESSTEKTSGVPEITGIEFDQVVLYEALPIENQDIFEDILTMTQVLSKYDLSADKIYFDASYEMTLYFGEVRAKLGDDENLEEKVARLSQLLDAAEGEAGVFRLENYTGSGSIVTFEKD